MKMKDVFGEHFHMENWEGRICDVGYDDHGKMTSSDKGVAACVAINNHDRLVEELREQKIDLEKVINNLNATCNDEAWSIIKLNHMIVSIDVLLAELEGN